jgi:hypothetical protein
MKNFIRLFTALFLFSAFSFLTSCEEETMENPDLVMANNLDITGGQEVPPVSTSGTGNLDVRYDKSTKQLILTFAWGNLSDTVTAVHIHGPAPLGTAGPVLVPFSNFMRSKNGAHTETFTVDEMKLKEAELLNGDYYINIHTNRYPAGEIRGQILFEKNK